MTFEKTFGLMGKNIDIIMEFIFSEWYIAVPLCVAFFLIILWFVTAQIRKS